MKGILVCAPKWTAAAAKSLQWCLTLCDPTDDSPPVSPRPWDAPGKNTGVGCHFLDAWKWKVKVKLYSCVQLLATSRTEAYQAPLSMGFSRQEYWSGVPLSSPIQMDYHTLNWTILPTQLQAALIKDRPYAKFRERVGERDSRETDVLLNKKFAHITLVHISCPNEVTKDTENLSLALTAIYLATILY